MGSLMMLMDTKLDHIMAGSGHHPQAPTQGDAIYTRDIGGGAKELHNVHNDNERAEERVDNSDDTAQGQREAPANNSVLCAHVNNQCNVISSGYGDEVKIVVADRGRLGSVGL
jgi:hypothetical protein